MSKKRTYTPPTRSVSPKSRKLGRGRSDRTPRLAPRLELHDPATMTVQVIALRALIRQQPSSQARTRDDQRPPYSRLLERRKFATQRSRDQSSGKTLRSTSGKLSWSTRQTIEVSTSEYSCVTMFLIAINLRQGISERLSRKDLGSRFASSASWMTVIQAASWTNQSSSNLCLPISTNCFPLSRDERSASRVF